MNPQDAAVLALTGYGVFLALAFGLRSLVHYWRTGATGYVGLSGRPGSAEWWGGVLFALAVLAAAAAPLAQLAGLDARLAPFDRGGFRLLGMALYGFGGIGTLWAQMAMGTSWRIGVDAAARTELVAEGPFRWVRNPIFTFMLTATLGLALLVPNGIAWAALLLLFAAVEIQVRRVEEPYLRRVHGNAYQTYCAKTGRFFPHLGLTPIITQPVSPGELRNGSPTTS